ncbi:PepSY domain-containing protein [Magnetospirillum sp. 15-1]|uniref:PepSY domain-containing protein n=1 Tax=Magnetospirillum sp. 15-1 TaxID=1979370 RepID=UPI000BBBB081|nr:PepSY domain-containing protein [Magnetospirillum sp. 15-1]
MLTKTALIAATVTGLALTSIAQAKDKPAGDILPPAVILNQMVADGHDLRALDRDHGRYLATVRAPSGQLATFSVDARTGELLPEAARLSTATTPETGTSAVKAMLAAAEQGHWNLSELEWKNDGYVVEARDDSGAKAHFQVDAATGTVTKATHR